ncbi:MAG: CDP-glucose 4,6-dehydratase [Candidatus Binataceae bacterium]
MEQRQATMGGVEVTGIRPDFWRGRSVMVTGHTGFKGGWLVAWLLDMGARVTGLGLAPDTESSFFERCGLASRMASSIGDIRDSTVVRNAIDAAQPEIIFHLAAQSLVRRSYGHPLETFAVNVMGTAHVLDAVRFAPAVRAVVIITSDKCYENREWLWGYREHEPMGGHDPYSASKGCAELVAAAYRNSYFATDASPVGVATARAGNVIGGGDWAVDRLVPDAVRALASGAVLTVRNPRAVRPWQHVLEPVAGYLMLAERLYAEGSRWAGAWNFGPSDDAAAPVSVVAELMIKHWGKGRWQHLAEADAPHEAHYLKLDCAKARALLGWQPALALEEAIAMTVEWYRAALATKRNDLLELTRTQLRRYGQGKAENPVA